MTQVVVSEQTINDLVGCSGRTALVDRSGAIIGYFEPAFSHDPKLYARARALFSDEELARRRQETGGLTSAEVWRQLAEMERTKQSGDEGARA